MVKITKALAKKMYDNGEEVMVIPNKIRPTGTLAAWYHKSAEADDTFEKLCDIIFYYNCSPEMGMSLAYYAKEV